MTVPVTFQLVVSTHPFEYHLFEMDYDDMPIVFPGMLLINVPGIPNIVGPDAEFDNKIVRLAYDGRRKRVLAQVGSFRDATTTVSEMKLQLKEWNHVRQIPGGQVQERDKFSG